MTEKPIIPLHYPDGDFPRWEDEYEVRVLREAFTGEVRPDKTGVIGPSEPYVQLAPVMDEAYTLSFTTRDQLEAFIGMLQRAGDEAWPR